MTENTDLTSLQGMVVGLELEMKKQARFVGALTEHADLQHKIVTDRCLELSERVHKLEAMLRSYGISEILEESQG
jgi:hypothetical protein